QSGPCEQARQRLAWREPCGRALSLLLADDPGEIGDLQAGLMSKILQGAGKGLRGDISYQRPRRRWLCQRRRGLEQTNGRAQMQDTNGLQHRGRDAAARFSRAPPVGSQAGILVRLDRSSA